MIRSTGSLAKGVKDGPPKDGRKKNSNFSQNRNESGRAAKGVNIPGAKSGSERVNKYQPSFLAVSLRLVYPPRRSSNFAIRNRPKVKSRGRRFRKSVSSNARARARLETRTASSPGHHAKPVINLSRGLNRGNEAITQILGSQAVSDDTRVNDAYSLTLSRARARARRFFTRDVASSPPFANTCDIIGFICRPRCCTLTRPHACDVTSAIGRRRLRQRMKFERDRLSPSPRDKNC